MNNIQNIYNKVSSSSKVLMLSALLCASSSVLAQEQVLKGRIVNSQGEPIPGAVVNVAEESRIALTDKDGYFTLKKVTPSDEICVSSVGYKNAQEKVTCADAPKVRSTSVRVKNNLCNMLLFIVYSILVIILQS